MFKINLFAVLLFIFCGLNYSYAQTTFYDPGTIQKIEVYFAQPGWDYRLDTAKYGSDDYIIADWVNINGIQYDSCGIKYKGNSSYDSTYVKNPFHIELDFVNNQSYQGYKDIKLGNGYADPSMIREVLAYGILKNYMDCPKANFAQLYINGNYIGLYSNDESINKDFCSTYFNSSSNTFFKCNPIGNAGPTTKSNLKYIPLADSSAYFNYYELKSDFGWNELVTLCDTVTNYPASVPNVIDIDRVAWMLAYNSVLVNLDSYSGVFCQNYYLYKDNSNRFNPVVWDLNMAFGGFPFAGSGSSSMASLSIANMQQFSPLFHQSDPYWPLINAVLNNASLRKQYIAHARTINNENFVNNVYLADAAILQSLVDTAIQSDNNKFFTYSQFQGGITTDYSVGSYTVPGISNLMSARASFLQSFPDFQFVPPSISNVIVSNNSPALNDVVTITAQVTNTNNNAVFLGYRAATSPKFDRVLMFDDGTHNDGAAGDNIYGSLITVSDLIIQFYVYAENNDAGIFSPERAEHEFYSLFAISGNPAPGEVVINEFLSWNVSDATNENAIHADWIELYNNTSSPLALYGTYLTDDYFNPTKFAFPPNTYIPANGFLMLWADEEPSTPSYLHCNFKLSSGGEQLMLSNGSGIIIDSVTFSSQSDDISFGRCPTGTGSFGFLIPTSFNNYNCSGTSLNETGKAQDVAVYPNPASSHVKVEMKHPTDYNLVTISNTMGRQLLHIDPLKESEFNISGLSQGLYFVRFINTTNGAEHIVKLMKVQ